MKKNRYLEYLEDDVFTIQFSWISKNTFAVIDTKDTITFNIYVILASLWVHEVLHYDHPKKDEDQILDMEDRQINRMTRKEIEELGQALLKRLLLSPMLNDV